MQSGMTAEVEIALPRLENVLAVPSEAVQGENGHDVCFVMHNDGLERREVKVGHVTLDMSEVTEGLSEGEHVVLNPPKEESDADYPSVRTDLDSAGPTPKPRRSLGEDGSPGRRRKLLQAYATVPKIAARKPLEM